MHALIPQLHILLLCLPECEASCQWGTCLCKPAICIAVEQEHGPDSAAAALLLLKLLDKCTVGGLALAFRAASFELVHLPFALVVVKVVLRQALLDQAGLRFARLLVCFLRPSKHLHWTP